MRKQSRPIAPRQKPIPMHTFQKMPRLPVKERTRLGIKRVLECAMWVTVRTAGRTVWRAHPALGLGMRMEIQPLSVQQCVFFVLLKQLIRKKCRLGPYHERVLACVPGAR